MAHTVAAPAVLEVPEIEITALKSRALRATLWTVLSYGAGQGLRVVNSLVLTRLLFPAAFGELMLVSTLITGMAMLSDIGLEPSVIGSQRGDDAKFLNTAWTLQAMRGVMLWCCAVLLAYPAARFYHDPKLVRLLPVLAFSVVISGFNGTGLLTLSRHMGVRRLFGIDFSTQIVTLIVTIAIAYKHPSVWALVAGNLVAAAYRLVLSHTSRVVPGHRNSFSLDPESLRDIVKFGKWIVLGTAFFFFATQSDRLILGKLVSLSLLGVYGIAYQISDIPRSVINALSQKVGFPFISKMSHLPRPEFRIQFLRYRRYALALGALLLSAMAVWGNLIILKLYPSRYAEASWMIPVLALGLWHTLLYTTTRPLLFSLGKSTYNAVGNAGYCLAMVVGMPLAFQHYNMFGAVVAVAAADLPLYAVTQFGATREGIRPLWQDLQLTGLFVALLAAEFLLRRVM